MENLYSRLSVNNKDLSLKYKHKEQFNFIDYITDLGSICIKEAAGALRTQQPILKDMLDV